MSQSNSPEDDDGLPAPGFRWGAGAHSVLPYLTRTLLAKPADAGDARQPPEHAGDSGWAELPRRRPNGR